jgi:prepilin-type N-terminal cleavage/methylation domain-containing protein
MVKSYTAVCKGRKGFTLIEALIAMAILGFAITALLVASRSFSNANGAGLELSTAEFLIEQIREQTATVPVVDPVTHIGNYAELTAFNGKIYSPPHDSRGNDLLSYPGYSQRITVQNVSATDLHTPDGSSKFYRITVEVHINNELISSASWIRANLNP